MQHEQAWNLALHHVFLNDCKRDDIRKSQFDTWLVQDFLFVREFTRLAATLLSVAPYSDFNVLLGGLVALKSELTWFEEQAVDRQIRLDAKKQEANEHFCAYMKSVGKQPYAVQAVVFWSIEQAYCQAWRNAMPIAEPYKEFANRWGSDDFKQYCKQLEKQTDIALQDASQEDKDAAVAACGKVAAHEQAFWQMAYEG